MKKKLELSPLLKPQVTLEEILAFQPGKPETYTSSRIVNVVCEKMFGPRVLSPEQVAQSLGIERMKLTHTMEVLTGYSLQELKIEMLIKRWHDYRAAHPKCKPHELAAVVGYKNYNAYWRFMGRYASRFPELKK